MSWRREHCALCRSTKLMPALDLGTTPLANEYVKNQNTVQSEYPLGIVLCTDCGHSQISYLVDAAILFKDYAYATSTSKVTLEHLVQEVRDVARFYRFKTGLALDTKSFVVEIGCNDGAMLDMWKKEGDVRVLGLDPAASRLKAHDVATADVYFTSKTGLEIKASHGAANIVVANNVFAHVPDVLGVAEGVKDVLVDGGLFVFEVSYLLDMAETPVFDTIYHEHMSYHAVKPLAMMLDKLGMPIVAAMRNHSQVGRGSLRVIACKEPGRSIDCEAARRLMMLEAKANLWNGFFWAKLSGEIFMSGQAVRSWVETLVNMGQTVAGYGAAAKVTTLMHVLKLGAEHICYIADDSKWKQGLYTPGKKVPIVPPEALLGSFAPGKPDACVIFAWNFANAIMANNKGYAGRWISPLPGLRETSLDKFRQLVLDLRG